jgi:predicted PurR-regulated permease PerM
MQGKAIVTALLLAISGYFIMPVSFYYFLKDLMRMRSEALALVPLRRINAYNALIAVPAADGVNVFGRAVRNRFRESPFFAGGDVR